MADLDAGEVRTASHGDITDLLVSYGYAEHGWVDPDCRSEVIEDGRDFFDDEGYALYHPARRGCAERGLTRMDRPFGGADYNALGHDGCGDVRPACAAYLPFWRDMLSLAL